MNQVMIVANNGYHQLALIGPVLADEADGEVARLAVLYPSLDFAAHPICSLRQARRACLELDSERRART